MTHRVLYLPILESGDNHQVASTNKRGLYDALKAVCPTYQLDYLAIPVEYLFDSVKACIETFEPTILLTQLHGTDRLSAENLKQIHATWPHLRILNWSGDSWKHSLVSEGMLELCRQFDLQMVAAPDVLPIYAENGIRAKFWQIGYESPVGELPEMPVYDVVFLGNMISDKRRALLEFLHDLKDVKVGVYGDWEHSVGRNTYNFGEGEALYKNAKLAIADCAYPDQVNYVSNRPIQILMAGGAMLLHERVPKIAALLQNIREGEEFEGWSDFDELKDRIIKGIQPDFDKYRHHIATKGQNYAKGHHTYVQRVKQLFEEFLPELEH